jgi:hypothetical protein
MSCALNGLTTTEPAGFPNMERIGKPFLRNGLKLAIDKIMQRG